MIKTIFSRVRGWAWQQKLPLAVALYWLCLVLAPGTWFSLMSLRPIVIDVVSAESIPQNTCNTPRPTDPCAFYTVTTTDSEYRNHDMGSWFGRWFIKGDSLAVQNRLRQSVGTGPQEVWIVGVRMPQMNWFPHILWRPTPVADVWIPPAVFITVLWVLRLSLFVFMVWKAWDYGRRGLSSLRTRLMPSAR